MHDHDEASYVAPGFNPDYHNCAICLDSGISHQDESYCSCRMGPRIKQIDEFGIALRHHTFTEAVRMVYRSTMRTEKGVAAVEKALLMERISKLERELATLKFQAEKDKEETEYEQIGFAGLYRTAFNNPTEHEAVIRTESGRELRIELDAYMTAERCDKIVGEKYRTSHRLYIRKEPDADSSGSFADLVRQLAEAKAEVPVMPTDWKISGSFLYRLGDDEFNCDEINITMAVGSRQEAPRRKRAEAILAMLSSPIAVAEHTKQQEPK